MGASTRMTSSLKLSASPLIDFATSSSSVHVMSSAEGPVQEAGCVYLRVLRRRGAADSRGWFREADLSGVAPYPPGRLALPAGARRQWAPAGSWRPPID